MSNLKAENKALKKQLEEQAAQMKAERELIYTIIKGMNSEINDIKEMLCSLK